MDGEATGAGLRPDVLPAQDALAEIAGWVLRPAVVEDVEVIAELRAEVMRPDLERLGRYDEHRVRQRFRDSFSAEYTSIIVVDRELAGCITIRPADDRLWLEHFYLAPRLQGRGLGSAVLRTTLEDADARGATMALNVLQGSDARRLYERHGFVLESEDPIDVFMIRPPSTPAHAAGVTSAEGVGVGDGPFSVGEGGAA